MTIKVFFAWYDFWIGAYWDRNERTLYVCPVPCVVIRLATRRNERMGKEARPHA